MRPWPLIDGFVPGRCRRSRSPCVTSLTGALPRALDGKIRDGWATSDQIPEVRIPGASFMGVSGVAPSCSGSRTHPLFLAPGRAGRRTGRTRRSRQTGSAASPQGWPGISGTSPRITRQADWLAVQCATAPRRRRRSVRTRRSPWVAVVAPARRASGLQFELRRSRQSVVRSARKTGYPSRCPAQPPQAQPRTREAKLSARRLTKRQFLASDAGAGTAAPPASRSSDRVRPA